MMETATIGTQTDLCALSSAAKAAEAAAKAAEATSKCVIVLENKLEALEAELETATKHLREKEEELRATRAIADVQAQAAFDREVTAEVAAAPEKCADAAAKRADQPDPSWKYLVNLTITSLQACGSPVTVAKICDAFANADVAQVFDAKRLREHVESHFHRYCQVCLGIPRDKSSTADVAVDFQQLKFFFYDVTAPPPAIVDLCENGSGSVAEKCATAATNRQSQNNEWHSLVCRSIAILREKRGGCPLGDDAVADVFVANNASRSLFDDDALRAHVKSAFRKYRIAADVSFSPPIYVKWDEMQTFFLTLPEPMLNSSRYGGEKARGEVWEWENGKLVSIDPASDSFGRILAANDAWRALVDLTVFAVKSIGGPISGSRLGNDFVGSDIQRKFDADFLRRYVEENFGKYRAAYGFTAENVHIVDYDRLKMYFRALSAPKASSVVVDISDEEDVPFAAPEQEPEQEPDHVEWKSADNVVWFRNAHGNYSFRVRGMCINPGLKGQHIIANAAVLLRDIYGKSTPPTQLRPTIAVAVEPKPDGMLSLRAGQGFPLMIQRDILFELLSSAPTIAQKCFPHVLGQEAEKRKRETTTSIPERLTGSKLVGKTIVTSNGKRFKITFFDEYKPKYAYHVAGAGGLLLCSALLTCCTGVRGGKWLLSRRTVEHSSIVE